MVDVLRRSKTRRHKLTKLGDLKNESLQYNYYIKSNVFRHRISQNDSGGVFTIKTIHVKINIRKITIIYITIQSIKA